MEQHKPYGKLTRGTRRLNYYCSILNSSNRRVMLHADASSPSEALSKIRSQRKSIKADPGHLDYKTASAKGLRIETVYDRNSQKIWDRKTGFTAYGKKTPV